VIRVRTHGVRGHLRRLPAGWKASQEAKEIAQGFGVLVPDGFTFVRPHVRGHGDGGDQSTAPAEIIVQARGLASVMMLLS